MILIQRTIEYWFKIISKYFQPQSTQGTRQNIHRQIYLNSYVIQQNILIIVDPHIHHIQFKIYTQMTQKPLKKPEFTTIDKLQRARSGYNIYAKVVDATPGEIKTRDGQTIPTVEAIIADQTASAKSFFKGDNAKLIKKGSVIAIRNGVKKIIKGKISLEVDLFGRVTPESVEINEKIDLNISDEEIKIDKNNQKGGNRPNRGRKPFNNRGQSSRGKSNYRRSNNTASFSRRNNNNSFRANRPDRKDLDYDRRNNNKPKPNFEQKKTKYQEKRGERGERVPLTKISQIDPGAEGLRFLAKVLEAEVVKGRQYNHIRCKLGDQTATVNAFLPESDHLVVGQTVLLSNATANVVKEHIQIQGGKGGRIIIARQKIREVNGKLNISEKSWVPIQ